MTLDDLEKKVNNLVADISQVSLLIEDFEKDFINEDKYFKQIKEIETTILNFQKLDIPIPEDLRKLKLTLVDNKNHFETFSRIKDKYYQCNKFFSQPKLNKATKKEKSYLSENSDVEWKKPKLIKILNHERTISHWKDVVLTTAEIMYKLHEDEFDKILNLKGKKRPYFSKDPNLLRDPRKIKSTNVYAEINMGAVLCMKLSKRVLNEFGYCENDVEVIYED